MRSLTLTGILFTILLMSSSCEKENFTPAALESAQTVTETNGYLSPRTIVPTAPPVTDPANTGLGQESPRQLPRTTKLNFRPEGVSLAGSIFSPITDPGNPAWFVRSPRQLLRSPDLDVRSVSKTEMVSSHPAIWDNRPVITDQD